VAGLGRFTTLDLALPFEPVKPDLRASDDDREAAAERLRTAALEGRLDHEELEERLALVYAARWDRELATLTSDVTPAQDPFEFWRPGRRELNPLAIVSLVAGMFWFGWLGSVAAVVLGHTALSQIARSRGTQTGRTAALIGTAFGYIGLAGLAMVLLYKFGI
jgi:Domain of unknown function (DUF1707)/Domain of unknown function (DUF4190)